MNIQHSTPINREQAFNAQHSMKSGLRLLASGLCLLAIFHLPSSILAQGVKLGPGTTNTPAAWSNVVRQVVAPDIAAATNAPTLPSSVNATNKLATDLTAAYTAADTVVSNGVVSSLAAGSFAQRHSVWLAKPDGLATNYSSLAAAKTAAAAGDVVTAIALNVSATNLLKNGVDYQLGGVSLSHSNRIPQSAGIALGIFDDRGQGAVTNTIKHLKLIDFRSQLTSDATALYETNPFANVTANAPIFITNPASSLHIEFDTIKHSIVGDLNNSAAVLVKDTSWTTIKGREIIDPLYLNAGVIIGYEEPAQVGPVVYASAGAGVYWGNGNMSVNVGRILSYGYGVYGSGGGSVVEEYFHTGDLIYSQGSAAVYIVGSSSNYRSWFSVPEIGSGSAQALTFFGSQRTYFSNLEKLYTDANGAYVVSLAVSGTPEVWVTSQKLSSTNGGWVWMSSGQVGRLHITAQDYIDTGSLGTAIGFLNQAGTNYIHGGSAKITAGKGIQHEGGRTFAENLYIDTATTTNAAYNPIYVTGAGLVLKDCYLIAPTGADSITATNAQTVTIVGNVYANTAKHANVTLAGPGTFTVLSSLPRL